MKFKIFILLFVLCACKGQKEANNSSANSKSYELSETLKASVIKALGSDQMSELPSPKSTYMLYLQSVEQNVQQPRFSQRYVVVDTKENSVIHKGVIEFGTVKWVGDTELEIFQEPGVMPQNATKDDFTFILDILSKERTPKKNSQ